jgi:hypothetical protein
MPEVSPQQPGRAWLAASQEGLGRRHALVLGGIAAAGTGLLSGRSAPDGASSVHHFRSRPDLRPAASVTDRDRGPVAPGVILTDSHGGPGQQGPMILNRFGELVWFRPLSSHASARLRAMNVRVQRYQGEPVITWWQGAVVNGHGRGHYVVANSSYQDIRKVFAHGGYRGDLHEFLLTDEGTALFSAYGTGRADLRSLGGSAGNLYYYGVVQEVDLATGRLIFSWRSDRHVPFRDSYARMRTSKTVGWDQFHINSIAVAPDGNLIVSARNTWTVYKIDRKTGKVIWRLGGKHNDFTMGRGTRFAWQHHVTALAGGRYTIFDNEAGDHRTGKRSRGLVLHVDEARRHVSLVRQYNPPVHVLAAALGSVQELPDGHVLIGWGERPYFTEYTARGSIAFSGHLAGRGTISYRAFKSPWTGRPAGRPAIAAARSHGGMAVYVSWNGDTQVRRWKVLAGPRPAQLSVVADAARHGFETHIQVGHAAAYVAAAGYDSSGHELGRSAVHHL